jgi:DNA primase
MDAARIEEVVGDFVALKKRGTSLIGNCPFHNEKTRSTLSWTMRSIPTRKP